MANERVSNCYGGSILTKYTARNVCSVTAEEAVSLYQEIALFAFNYFRGGKNLVGLKFQ